MGRGNAKNSGWKKAEETSHTLLTVFRWLFLANSGFQVTTSLKGNHKHLSNCCNVFLLSLSTFEAEISELSTSLSECCTPPGAGITLLLPLAAPSGELRRLGKQKEGKEVPSEMWVSSFTAEGEFSWQEEEREGMKMETETILTPQIDEPSIKGAR